MTKQEFRQAMLTLREDPSFCKAVQLLAEKYLTGKTLPYVRDPIAWALHQVWKQMDATGSWGR